MPLCMWLLNKINVAYSHTELDGGAVIPMTSSDVGVDFELGKWPKQ